MDVLVPRAGACDPDDLSVLLGLHPRILFALHRDARVPDAVPDLAIYLLRSFARRDVLSHRALGPWRRAGRRLEILSLHLCVPLFL